MAGCISVRLKFLPELHCLPEVKYAHKHSRALQLVLPSGMINWHGQYFFSLQLQTEFRRLQGNGFVPTWDKVT